MWDYLNSNPTFCDESFSIRDRIWFIKNSIKKPKTCLVCDKITKIHNNKQNLFCSKTCQFEYLRQTSEMQERAKKRNNKKANEKRRKSLKEKYGYEYNSQRPEIKKLLSKRMEKQISSPILSKINDRNWMEEQYIHKRRSSVDIARELGIFYGTVLDRVIKFGFEKRSRSNYSIFEIEIQNFLKDLQISFIENDRIFIEKELDILIPDYNLAIEVNGVYWHSFPNFETKEQKEKHLKKTLLCQQKNIHLIHVETSLCKEKIYSLVKQHLNLNQKIYARKCQIEIVDKKEEKQFLEQNHLQGYVPSKICYGLYYDEKLVSIISYGVPRFAKNRYNWELLRFCNKLNTNVIGGASKLFKKRPEGSIISYCDRSKFTGNLYQKLGFEFSHNTKPGYYWTDGNSLFNRLKFQKHKLSGLLENFDIELSETENMFNHGYRRYWDCGQSVWILR